MQDPQGQVPAPPADPTTVDQGQVQVPPADGSQVIPQPPAAEPQGQVDPNVQAAIQLANQRQARIYQLEQEIARQQQQVQLPAQQNENPYDYATNFPAWQRWETQNAIRVNAQETSRAIIEQLTNVARQQSEAQWQMAHPNVDINTVKEWGRMNGVTNLDHAYTLMTLPQQRTNAVQQVFNQFQRPQNSALPLQGTQGAAPQEMQGRFDKDYAEYSQTNGKVYESWTPEHRQAFDLEWRRREAARSAPRG